MVFIPNQNDDREYQGEFAGVSTEELRKIVKQGVNIHYSTSKSAKAKRELDDRMLAQNIEDQKKLIQLMDNSLSAMTIIAETLQFFKKHFLPKQSWKVRILTFFGGTILLGVGLNLLATYIALFWLGWR